MIQKIDIHGLQSKLVNTVAMLENPDKVKPTGHNSERLKTVNALSKNNRKLLLDFYNDNSSLTAARRQKLMCIMIAVASMTSGEMDKAKRPDIEALVRKIDARPLGDSSKHDYKVIIKKFYKWLRKTEDGYPDEVRWIKTTFKNGHKLPEELLTEDDVKLLIDNASHPRDKALIMMLYETGMRVGELASALIRHVSFDKYGAVVVVTGKTGDRRVRIVAAAPLLSSWLDCHPFRNDTGSPLWVGIGKHSKSALSYNAINYMLADVAKKAGLKKRIYPHLFRHSRATFLARHMTESQLKQYLGWTQASDMASIYVHLSGRDTDDAILEINGINSDTKEKRESALKPKKCPRCDTINPATARFCQRCSLALDILAAMKMDEQRMQADEMMNKLMDDKKVQAFLAKRFEKIESALRR